MLENKGSEEGVAAYGAQAEKNSEMDSAETRSAQRFRGEEGKKQRGEKGWAGEGGIENSRPMIYTS